MEARNRLTEAAALYRQAIDLSPQDAAAHCNLGDVLLKLNRLDEAIACYGRTTSLNPNLAEAYSNRSLALDSLGRSDEAIADSLRALQLKPRMFQALDAMGNFRRRQKQYADAIRYFRQALQVQPSSAKVHHDLGMAFIGQGEFEQACQEWRKAIQCDPSMVSAYANLGLALQNTGKYDESLAVFDAGMKIAPDDPDLHTNRAMTLLVMGQFEQGFRDYDHRWKTPAFADFGRDYGCPRWEGSDLFGKRLLIWHEQGLGDTIHFIRYAKTLANRGAEVIVEAPATLHRLLRTMPEISRIISRDDPAPVIDFHTPLLRIPGLVGTTLASIPADVPYLSAPQELIDEWSARLAKHQSPRVGLVWHGSPTNTLNAFRSIPLSSFLPLVRIPGVQFFSLQIGAGADQLRSVPFGAEIIDLAGFITDFADTAAAIANLDLVITRDTSVAHLAGAIGQPVWTILSYAPDFRWLRQRLDSPWYPTMRLFRQARMGDWQTPIQQAARSLQVLVHPSK